MTATISETNAILLSDFCLRLALVTETSHVRQALTKLELQILHGENLELPELDSGLLERLKGLQSFAQNNDLNAISHFLRSLEDFPVNSLERAISERCYGLALIRVQREVEGTFALERSDPILERYGVELFELEA